MRLSLCGGEGAFGCSWRWPWDDFARSGARLALFAGSLDSSVPASAFCLGPISVKGNLFAEHGSVRYRSASHPDVVLSVDKGKLPMWPSPTPNKGAVGQMSSPKKNRIDNVLRQGERQVAGIRAIESIRSALPKEAGEQEKLSLSLLTVQAVRPARLANCTGSYRCP